MICGSKCLDRPKFQVTAKLFEYTLQRLALFSHVLFLEDINSSYKKFANDVGWRRAQNLDHKNKRMNGNKIETKSIRKELTENLRCDPFMTALDDALYNFARKRYEGDYANHSDTALLVKEFANSKGVQDYFRDGLGRNCKDPCCGECSKW